MEPNSTPEVTPPSLQHTLPQEPVAPQAPSQPIQPAPHKKSKLPLVLTVLLILVLISGLGYLGYLHKQTSEKLSQAKTELQSTKSTLETANNELQHKKKADEFTAKYNNANLSRSLCAGKPVGMFDVHVNDKFTVYRYLCANTSGPILIGASKKLPDGNMEFTYGSSPLSPNKLPSYIYDTEPSFFGGAYGTTRF